MCVYVCKCMYGIVGDNHFKFRVCLPTKTFCHVKVVFFNFSFVHTSFFCV